jgi:hypothetical protein
MIRSPITKRASNFQAVGGDYPACLPPVHATRRSILIGECIKVGSELLEVNGSRMPERR